MSVTQSKARSEKHMSLSPQTSRIRARVAQMSKDGRKHWDLFRYLLDPFVLFDATCLVIRNGGAPGLDGQTIESIKGKEWDFATSLSSDLRASAYRPGAVRRAFIPKGDGDKRPLGIPDLKDRVIQRALVLLMECIYEQRFHDFSYGFRPKRKAVDCVALVAKTTYTHRHVLEADITKFFDQVSHKKLMKLLEKEIVDPRILRLVAQFLSSGFQEPGKPWQPSIEGTPQGGPLSPCLANIYLHYLLDERFNAVYARNKRVQLFRYADDFVIVAVTVNELKTARRLLNGWMSDAGLALKPEKTREIDMSNHKRSYDSKFDFLGFKIHLRSYKDNPTRFWVARQPSEKSRRNLRLALRERMQAHLHPRAVAERTLATWRGWCNYFRYSNANRVFYRECDSIRKLAWRYLRRKFRRTSCPVPWSRLKTLHDELMMKIRPIQVIPEHLSGDRQQSFAFGRA